MQRREATEIGIEMMGKYAQSSLLTEISECGQKKVLQPKQQITGYEIIDGLGECQLMLNIGGGSVLYETVFNY